MGCLDDRQLAELASGESPSHEHVDNCPSCTARLQELRLGDTRTNPGAKTPGGTGFISPTAPGAHFGRYLIIERLGAGGMGEVFSAFDPQLDRKVALKLLRVDKAHESDSHGRERLQREARAMAQVAHPNVAAVHDVGTHEGQVFVAMEFINGPTLREWCQAPGRTLEQILDVYQQCGRGLAAAHRAGLIHRDFKPANVLVSDGRARVLDFGLARISNVAPVERAPQLTSSSSELTVAGTMMGTPAYMPPEQFDGVQVDARADQFSFCVSLYESLAGVRPFVGDDLFAIRAAITKGLPPQAPKKIRPRLYAALRRGLAHEREDRFPSMDALLAALSNETQLRRRRLALTAALVLTTLLAAGGLISREIASRHCASPEPRLAGAWDASRRAALLPLLSTTSVPARLDAYAAQWASLSLEVCEAHRGRSETPTAKYVLQTACLERRLSDLRALTSVLVAADPAILKGATVAVSGLRPVSTCLDASSEYAEAEATQTDVEAQLSEAQALARLGQGERALTLATAIREDPVASRRAQAEAWLVSGVVEHANNRFPEAERSLNTAASKALAAGSFEVAAKAWSLLVDLYGRRIDQPRQAHEKADLAAGALTRLGDDPEIAAYYFDAVGRFQLGESAYAAAASSFEKAVANAERAWGPDHPEVAGALEDLGWAHSWLGQSAQARDEFARALRIKSAVYAEDSLEIAETLGRYAIVVRELGELKEATEMLERSLRIRRAANPNSFAVTTSLTNLADLYMDAGRLEDALASIDQSLAILAKILVGDHLRVVGNLHTRGNVLLALGRLDEAKSSYADSLAMSERVKGKEHVLGADAIEGLAAVALEKHQPLDAIPLLERALSLRERSPASTVIDARPKFLLARALWESGKDVPRAKELLEAARSGFAAGGATGHQQLGELTRWEQSR
ncbi:MAG: serine/threonine-protein kinase [Archangium sp.]